MGDEETTYGVLKGNEIKHKFQDKTQQQISQK